MFFELFPYIIIDKILTLERLVSRYTPTSSLLSILVEGRKSHRNKYTSTSNTKIDSKFC